MSGICIAKQNTGASTCAFAMEVLRRLAIVPEFKADGSKFEFANTAAVTKSALQAAFDASDIDDRIFPLPELENVEDVKGDTVFFEYNSGNKVRIRKGARSFTGIMPLEHPAMIEQIESWHGQKFGIIGWDASKNFVFNTDQATKVKVQPILVDGNSLDVKLVKATDADPLYIMISFDFRVSAEDSLLRMNVYENLDYDGLDTNDVYGLWDVTPAITYSVITSFIFACETAQELPETGIVIGDVALYNVTQSLALTPDSVTESPDGTYTCDLTTEDGAGNVVTADTVRLTITRAKYDHAVVTEVAP